VTTREGKGAIDDRNPLAVGTMWVNPRLRPVLDAADVVLAVGTRLQGFGFPATTKIVHVDVDAAREGVPDDAIIVPATTTVGYMAHMYLPVYEPRTYLSSSYMGTLGFAFPTALGAKVARPDRPVVALVGDGGF